MKTETGKTFNSTLRSILSQLHRHLYVNEILQMAVTEIPQQFGLDGASIHLYDAKSKQWILQHVFGIPLECGKENISVKIDSDLAFHVLTSGEPWFIPDPLRSSSLLPNSIGYVGIPLVANGEYLGVWSGYAKHSRGWSLTEREFFVELGEHLAVAIENAQLYEQAETKAHRLIAISRVITATRQLGTLDWVLQEIAKVLVQTLGFDLSWIGLIENQSLQGKAGFGKGLKKGTISITFPLHSEVKNSAVECILREKPVVSHSLDMPQAPHFLQWLETLKVHNFAFVPILGSKEALGALGVFYITPHSIQEEDLRVLTSVSEQVAIAIENATLYERVKMSEERYRTLFESTGTSLVILDPQNRFQWVNQAFEALSGYSREELIGKKSFFDFFSQKSQLPLLYGASEIRSPQTTDCEVLFIDRQGKSRHVHLSATLIPDSDDLLVSLMDMTRERELERRLFKSEELAAIGELSAGIAHEIRNPLVAMTTSIALLSEEPSLSPEGQQVLNVLKEEAHHLAAIVDDFLKFARPKKPVWQEENLNQLLHEVVKRHKELVKNEIQWIEAYDPNLPLVELDRHQFQQVITNLILNAVDAMPKGGTLKVSSWYKEEFDGLSVHVAVSDSGVGIREADRTKIFQPFYSTKERGTGMGLAICRRIVSQHGGEISFETEEKKGSTFIVRLPVRASEFVNSNQKGA